MTDNSRKRKARFINFRLICRFYVGYSTAEKHWSYVLPGPLDGWAGGGYWAGYYPRHFPSIYFNLDNKENSGESVLSLFFAGANQTNPLKIRIEINGHRFEKR